MFHNLLLQVVLPLIFLSIFSFAPDFQQYTQVFAGIKIEYLLEKML